MGAFPIFCKNSVDCFAIARNDDNNIKLWPVLLKKYYFCYVKILFGKILNANAN